MSALFELVAEYRTAARQLEDLDLDSQTLADTLDSIVGDVEVKAQQVAYVAMNLTASADAIRTHAAMQMARAKSLDARATALKEYLGQCMTNAGIKVIEGAGVKLAFRKSIAVQIDGVDLIPSEYMRQPATPPTPPPEPDKAAIKAAWKLGVVVPGASEDKRSTLTIS